MYIINKRDFVASIVLLLAMVAFFIESKRIDITGGVDLGPLFFPYLMISIIFILSIILLFKSISFTKPNGEHQNQKFFNTTKDQNIFLLLFFAYLIALPIISYLPATIIYLLITMIYLGQSKIKKWIIIYICSTLGMTAFVYYIFANVMSLFLP